MYKNIIWDFDGTLFDTYPGLVDSFKRALSDNGIEVSEGEIIKHMKISMTMAVNYFKEKYTLSDEFIERFIYYDKNYEIDKVLLFPFAKEICSAVNNNGGRNFILTHRGSSTFKFLKHHGMTDYFEEIVTQQNGFKRKPDPEAFLYFTKKYKINNDTVLAIGDRECDILGAKNANITTCLYNTNRIESIEKPDFSINSLLELYSILCLSK